MLTVGPVLLIVTAVLGPAPMSDPLEFKEVPAATEIVTVPVPLQFDRVAVRVVFPDPVSPIIPQLAVPV